MGSQTPSIDFYAKSLDMIEIKRRRNPNYLGPEGFPKYLYSKN
jgi:hypothetical protein